jgi:hypothetical protein
MKMLYAYQYDKRKSSHNENALQKENYFILIPTPFQLLIGKDWD